MIMGRVQVKLEYSFWAKNLIFGSTMVSHIIQSMSLTYITEAFP